MYARILVATDLSEDADRAIAAADEIAKRDGAELAVCHVTPDLQQLSVLFPQGVAKGALDVVEFERRAGEVVAERVRALTGRDANEVFIDSGADYAVIVSNAERSRADLVVTGSHGHTGMRRALLGSVSEKVVRYAHANVLVVRRAEREDGPVVAATDLSDLSLVAVEVAAREATRRGRELVVLHAIDTLPLVAGNAMGTPLGVYGIGLDAKSAEALVSTAQVALDGALDVRGIRRVRKRSRD